MRWILAALLVMSFIACQSQEPEEDAAAGGDDTTAGAESTDAGARQASFVPVPLPDPNIPGFQFPQPEATIDGWVANGDSDAIHSHTWGLWTALTSPSGEEYDGQELLVFETWYTPQDIQQLPADQQTMEVLRSTPRDPRPLSVPHQFQGEKLGLAADVEVGGGLPTVLGFVKYDPSAADHTVQQDLFSKSTLNSLLDDGEVTVPDFPATAMVLKPVFQTLSPARAVDGRYVQIPAWPGTPDPPRPFPSSDWGECVWVDLEETGGGTGSGAVDTTCAQDGSSRTADNTYGLGTFIHFELTAQVAEAVNRIRSQQGAEASVSAGNVAVLVAMHVTSREITRWTWQSFWWSADPDSPNTPSSAQVASLRPSQLQGPARHYAACSAFQMVDPSQPITGGSNTGNSVYCFNPHLEASFSPSVLPASEPGTYNGQQVANDVGVQTNCMSCHAMAAWEKPNGGNLESTLYAGDRYVDLEGSEFNDRLRLDFLWSIANSAQ